MKNVFITNLDILFVAIGTIFLAVGLFYAYKITKEKVTLAKYWKIFCILIGCFIVGYTTFIYIITTTPFNPLTVIVAAVFFGGGVFVFLVARLSLGTIAEVKKVARLQYEADRDIVTGLYNRKYFRRYMKQLLPQINRGGPSAVLAFMDLDKFKCVNDVYGHLEGDQLLIKIAKILRKNTRSTDIIVRAGGDEFIVLLYNSDLKRAKFVLTRAIDEMRKFAIRKFKKCKQFGCSAGYALIDKGDNKNIDELIKFADEQCYIEKHKHHKDVR